MHYLLRFIDFTQEAGSLLLRKAGENHAIRPLSGRQLFCPKDLPMERFQRAALVQVEGTPKDGPYLEVLFGAECQPAGRDVN